MVIYNAIRRKRDAMTDEREMNENKEKSAQRWTFVNRQHRLFALPTSIMKVICPRSIPRQCALSAFSDTVFGTGTIA